MNTSGPENKAFAIWVTGLPASGKSTLVAAVNAKLAALGIDAAVLESDRLREILTPHATYSAAERDMFYAQMTYIGRLLLEHRVPVIFDATANRRLYRDRARQAIPRFLEVFLDCPLETCMARDPKGIYRRAREKADENVPGLQALYEPPENPDIVIHAGKQTVVAAAGEVVGELRRRGWLGCSQPNSLPARRP